MIHPFKPDVSDNWHKHPDGVDHVRDISRASGCGNWRTEQIVQPEDMDDIKSLHSRAAVAFCRGIPTERAVAEPRRQIDGLHVIFHMTPAKRRTIPAESGQVGFRMSAQALLKAPVRRKHVDRVATARKSFR